MTDPALQEPPGDSANYVRAILNIMEDFSDEKVHLQNIRSAVLNILDDSHDETARLNHVQDAVLNILEDTESDKMQMRATQRALLNILEDSESDTTRMHATQRAVLNILEDQASDETQMHATQRAVLNILEDSESDTARMHATQRAVLNILEDSESDKSQMRATQRAVINILEDFDSERVERMRADELVRALNRDLEARVVQRTAALTAANQELESFAYSVAHDLRAPLRAIDGFSLIIHEENSDVLSEDGKDALRRVRAASQRMGALIDDMLKLAHSTRGVIDVAVVDLSAIAEAVAQSLVSSSPTRDVRVSIARSVIGLGDGVLLRTVLENLLANAWKFTAKTPAAVIEFGSQERGGELICYVRDNGAGFDMAYEHNLFLPFQRLHRPSDFPGNGIGLATVKRIVARLGGRVWAVGAVNQGATFYFSLPRVTAARGKELP